MASRRLFDGAQIEIGSIPIVGAGVNPGISLSATEEADSASFTVDIAGANPAISLGATESPDVAAFSVAARIGVSLGATEASDVAAFAVGVVSAAPAVNLTATEGPDVADFAVVGPAIEQTNGGAGSYFSNVPNFARKFVDIREELEEKPTPEVVREAARSIVQTRPDIEPAELQTLIDDQLRAYDLLSSLLEIAQEEARLELERLQMIEQDEEEIQQAIRMLASYMQ
jgi:hypothetical protein